MSEPLEPYVPATSIDPTHPPDEDDNVIDLAAGDEVPAILAPPSPRFCNRCGNTLDEAARCIACHDARTTPDPRLAAVTPGKGARGVTASLALYFALLGTFVLYFIDDSIEMELIVSAVDSLIVLIWVGLMAPRRVFAALRPPADPRWWLAAVALSAATFAAASGAMALAAQLGVEEIFISPPLFQAGYGWFTVIIIACVQPAVFEELAFRGVLVEGFSSVMSRAETIVVSALLFMTIHLAFAAFPHLFLIGLTLGWLRFASGSLLPPMLLHLCHNLWCILSETVTG